MTISTITTQMRQSHGPSNDQKFMGSWKCPLEAYWHNLKSLCDNLHNLQVDHS